MKYEIIKNGIDDYTLKYKDKEINYHTDIELMKQIQEAPKIAKIEMLKDLAKDGISLKDFTIEQKLNGKTYYDNTNKNELENTYYQNKILEIINNKCISVFGFNLQNLILDIGLETQEEQETFSSKLGASLLGNFPSK